MFEMFALLINLLTLTISDAMDFLRLNKLFFSFGIHVCSSATQKVISQPSSALSTWEFVVGICRENLPHEFAVKFTVAICRGFFVFVSKSFFLDEENFY